MNFEHEINLSNQYYLDLGIANIHKKPTPITIVKVDYPSRSKAKIVEAYYKVPSTTDYNGIYDGHYIDFEAKETHSKTAFALSNLHPHQIHHMEDVKSKGGISFILVRFVSFEETYLILIEDVLEFIRQHSRKSLPYTWIKEKAYLIPYKLTPPVDYVSIVKKIV